MTKITFRPKEKRPVEDFLKTQGRFKHIFKPENESIIKELQDEIDREWDRLHREETLFAAR